MLSLKPVLCLLLAAAATEHFTVTASAAAGDEHPTRTYQGQHEGLDEAAACGTEPPLHRDGAEDDQEHDYEDDDDGDEVDLADLAEGELREICTDEGLPADGDKDQLLERIITHFGVSAAGNKSTEDLSKWSDDALDATLAALADGSPSIERFLSPALLADPDILADARRQLRDGKLVALRNAFHPAFAESVHRDLRTASMPWALNEANLESGFAYQHHNVYDPSLWSERLRLADDTFKSSASKRWVEELTGRDCSGEAVSSPSHYKAGDHSLPHTDWAGQRTVAFVWHLSAGWRPEWGGALYWLPESLAHVANSQYAASFNTLILFSVTTRSAHLVTPVSRHAAPTAKRLAVNGWYQSAWEPLAGDDEQLDAVLGSAEGRAAMTQTQLQAVERLLSSPQTFKGSEERRARLMAQYVQALDAHS